MPRESYSRQLGGKRAPSGSQNPKQKRTSWLPRESYPRQLGGKRAPRRVAGHPYFLYNSMSEPA